MVNSFFSTAKVGHYSVETYWKIFIRYNQR